jgi:hypothetical protein
MPLGAPVSYHLDLYRYWCEKRGNRAMPARSDIEAGDICALLPYLTILDKVDGRYRYRLIGSAAAQEIGRDMTGGFVGSYVSSPESAAAMQAVCEHVFSTARPIFSSGEFRVKPGSTLNTSVLLLPLSDDGVAVNMVVCTLIARLSFDGQASSGWLEGIPVKLRPAVDIDDVAELENCCRKWDQLTSAH